MPPPQPGGARAAFRRYAPRSWGRWGLLVGSLLCGAGLVAVAVATVPPTAPDYADVVAAWHPSEAWLYDRNGTLIDSQRVDFQARRLAWTPLSSVPVDVRRIIVGAEDQRFASHGGVDGLALLSAARQRFFGGGARSNSAKGRGASTLTMQLAGYLSPEVARPGARSWLDKIRQMRAAWAIERGWSKDQILEAYLNLAPFRGEAQGVGAAALTLFGKAPAHLSRQDGVILAALLPDPRAGQEGVRARACRIARADGIADCTALAAQVADMLAPARVYALDPGLTPHLAASRLTRPGMRLRTTLDASVQRLAIAALKRHLAMLGATRARDGAVVVLDNASGDVLAYVGGVGLDSTAAAVDGADALRQAGSTLKPFLYAQAFERGWLTAASILDDSPVQLDTASGLYVPQNYDRQFKGLVSARTALASSLNVPAVRTLLIVGVEPFRDRLNDLGYTGLTQDGDYYGYSLALGSAEVTLLQQVNAYRVLANGGLWSPIRILSSDPVRPPHRVMSAGSAWITTDILADASARATTFGVDSALHLPFWAAAKTGTSKAMRDNWCIGFTQRYTVGVWIGNSEGDSMRAVSGTSGAAPVWRDLMIALAAQDTRGPAPAAPPQGMMGRRIVFVGGMEPARKEWFLPGTAQDRIAAAPPMARRPRILAPLGGSVYALDPDIPMKNQRLGITLSATLPGHRLILDDRPLGDAVQHQLVLLGPGVHRLILMDPAGRKIDTVRFIMR